MRNIPLSYSISVVKLSTVLIKLYLLYQLFEPKLIDAAINDSFNATENLLLSSDDGAAPKQVPQNEPQSSAPKNHRMDSAEIQPEIDTNLLDQDSLRRFEGYHSSLDFLQSEVYNKSTNNQLQTNKQQWSVAYNQDQNTNEAKNSFFTPPGYSVSSPATTKPNAGSLAPHFGIQRKKPNSAVEVVSFDDDYDGKSQDSAISNHITSNALNMRHEVPKSVGASRMTTSRYRTRKYADDAASLREAQIALKENLALQDKLIALLDHVKNNAQINDPQRVANKARTGNFTNLLTRYAKPVREPYNRLAFKSGPFDPFPVQVNQLSGNRDLEILKDGDWLPAPSISNLVTTSANSSGFSYEPPLHPHERMSTSTKLTFPPQYSTSDSGKKVAESSIWQVSKPVDGRRNSNYPLDDTVQLENFFRRQRQVDQPQEPPQVTYERPLSSNDIEYDEVQKKFRPQGQPGSVYSTLYTSDDETTSGLNPDQAPPMVSASQQAQLDPLDEAQVLDGTWSMPVVAQRDYGQKMHLLAGSAHKTGASSVSQQRGRIRLKGAGGGLISRARISRPDYLHRNTHFNTLSRESQFYNNQPVTTIDLNNPLTSDSSLANYHEAASGGVSEYRDLSSPSHQVVHIHSKEKKGHGKYLWPIVGGGLTMLMGFLIISNILLSIPLLAIGASTLFNSQLGGGGGFQSQQLVPVYNLSQIATRPSSSGRRRRRRRRRRKKRWAISSRGGAGDQLTPSARRRLIAGDAKTVLSGLSSGLPTKHELKLEAELERLIDNIVTSSGVSRLLNTAGGWFGKSGLTRKQVLKAAYCHRPIKIKQPLVF